MNGKVWAEKLNEELEKLSDGLEPFKEFAAITASVSIMGKVTNAVQDLLNPCNAALAPIYIASLSAVIESIAGHFPDSEKMAKALLTCTKRISYSKEEAEKQILSILGGLDENEK